MYQELVQRHYADSRNQLEKHPHVVRMVDTLVDDDHIEWCLANLKMDSWTWSHESNRLDVDFAVFTFSSEDDAMLFKLTWS